MKNDSSLWDNRIDKDDAIVSVHKNMKLPLFALAAGLFASILFSGSAAAATLNATSIADVTIRVAGDNYFAASNGGAATVLQSTTYYTGIPIMRFDTSGFGALAGATINSVTLNFVLSGTLLAGGSNFQLAQLTSANSGWVEGTGSGPGDYTKGGATLQYLNKDAGSAASYSVPGTGTVWGGGGNFSNGAGFSGNAATVYTLTPPTITYNPGEVLSFTLNNAIITNWLADGSLALAGLAIARTAVDGPVFNQNPLLFYSHNAGAGLGPTITIDYTVPEPGTVALLGLGGLTVLGLRRRRA